MSMTLKPWTPETYMRDTRRHGAIYVRMKGFPGAGSLLQSVSPEGVNVFYTQMDGKTPGVRGLSWLQLFLECEQFDGSVCGTRR